MRIIPVQIYIPFQFLICNLFGAKVYFYLIILQGIEDKEVNASQKCYTKYMFMFKLVHVPYILLC